MCGVIGVTCGYDRSGVRVRHAHTVGERTVAATSAASVPSLLRCVRFRAAVRARDTAGQHQPVAARLDDALVADVSSAHCGDAERAAPACGRVWAVWDNAERVAILLCRATA
jgi:hypothetical protein